MGNFYSSNGPFTESGLNNVLIPMKKDPASTIIESLACVCPAMHPEGKQDEFFRATHWPRQRQRVWAFSMSAFLRISLTLSPLLRFIYL
jgi:hypothetical protein